MGDMTERLDTPEHAPAPEQTIGVVQGTALYVCAILGAGVLVLPGQAASLAGPASLLAWGFSLLAGLPLAFTFAALASRHPDAGGVATYAARAFGPAAGGIAGWWYFIAGSVGQTIVPLTAGYYLCAAAGLDQRLAPLFAAGVLAAAVAANLAGLRIGARLQIALAAAVAVILAAVIVIALPQLDPAAFRPFAPAGPAGIGRATIVLFFAFAGWEAIAHLSGEFQDVRRTLPLATACTAAIVGILYLGVALAVVGTGTYGTPELDRIALGRIVENGLGLSAVVIMGVAAAIICLGTTNAFVASVSRLGFALGRDGWAPHWLGRRSARGVPVAAVLTVGGIGGAGLLGSALFGWGTDDLVFVPSVLVLVTYLLGAAAAWRLFSGRSRWVAGLAVALLLIPAPFAAAHLLVPAAIAAILLGWRVARGRRTG